MSKAPKFGPMVSLFALLPAAAFAQVQDSSVEEPEEAGLPTIIVTGEKTRRTLQDTQSSVAVLTAEQIQDLNVENFRDVFRVMGNVIDADWVDAGFVIRGVNSEGLTPGGDPLATLYIDGAPQTVQGARRGARGLFDTQQIEVYRGPQSTLSGRASLAGAIYVTTQDPIFEPEVKGRIQVGELDTFQASVAGNVPLSDRIAVRLVAEYQRDESDLNYPGYEPFVRFDDFIEDEYYQVRGKLLFEPEEVGGWRVLLAGSYAFDSPTYDDIAGPGLGSEYSERRGDLNAGLPFFQENREAENINTSLRITKAVTDNIDFTSLTTAAITEVFKPSINEGTPGEQFVNTGTVDQRRMSQELRLNGSYDSGLQWVLGLYAEVDDTEDENERSVFFGGGRTDFALTENELLNYAIFGEVNVPAGLFELIAGGRLLREERDQTQFFQRAFFSGAPAQIFTGEADFGETVFLPKAGVVYNFSPDVSLGASAQRGYRGGGAFINQVTGQPTTFDSEFTWTYEMAFRSVFAGGNARLNANIFYTDWTDQQVNFQQVPGDPTSDVIVNAGESSLYGAEVEAQFKVSARVDTFVSLGYVETNFDEFITTAFGDLSGLPFPESPNVTVSAGLNYKAPSGFFFGADGRLVDEYLARDLQNAPVDPVGNYAVFNFRVGWDFDRFRVVVFADNAFGEDYFVYRDRIGDFDCCATLGPRRLIGAEVNFNF
ncbi:MAG: TonB-dependent receptor [Pseudomonadota bacterium]